MVGVDYRCHGATQEFKSPTLNPIITSSHIVTSDHYPIFTSINVHPNQPPPPITVTYRRINAIDYTKFIDDVNSSPLITNPPSCLPDLLDLFFAIRRSLLDHHAPLLTKTNKSSRTASTPWITTEIFSLKSARRRQEHTYIATHSIFDLELLLSATNHHHKFIAAARKSFNASFILSSSSKPRALWKTVNNILQRTANRYLPTTSPLAALPQLFVTYISDKISQLHFILQTNHSSTSAHSFPPSSPPLLHSFTPATLLEIDNLLSQSSDSYCDLDPVSTTVLKKISNAISPTILSIVNLSITTSTFPSTLKSSIISHC